MNRLFQQIPILVICASMAWAGELRSQTLALPVSGQGANAKTLVVYSGIHAPYSIADDLAALKLQLRRVATAVEDVPAAAADLGQVAAANYVVVFCPQPYPDLPAQLVQAIARRQNPVLWVGYGADKLERFAPFEGQFKVAAFASEKTAETISYQGRNWDEPMSIWIPVQIPATNSSAIIMAANVQPDGKDSKQPFAWKSSQVTFYTALPTLTANCGLFSDLLLDFYGATAQAPGAVCVRIDGYHCRQDHVEFRNLVSSLAEHDRTFIVGVIPAYYDADHDKILDIDSQPEFVAALRFAQQHGGRLVMQGYLLGGKGRSTQLSEFWDNSSDHPLAEDSPAYVSQRIEKGIKQMIAKGLFPIGWMTPHYAASRVDYGEIAKYFSTAVERVQLSETTAQENFAGSACGMDDYGRFIVPENLGIITGGRSALVRIQDRAITLSQLRGTVSLFSFPAHLTDDKLAQAVKALEQAKVPFLDLLEGDHWVQTPDTLILTGKARRVVNLNNARVRWQAYDRNGKLISEEFEPMSTTGERTFERRGKGDYEVYQFNQGKS